jgi:glycosyltransferase involved in cell wall biosynthesis
VFRGHFENFSDLKNFGISKAKNEWIMIVDADERIPERLAREIMSNLDHAKYDAFLIPFRTFFFGREMRWGGWDEKHVRIIRKDLARYSGDIHETFDIRGLNVGRLKSSIIHLTHRSILHNLLKTANYADVQARQMLTWHPRVRVRTLFGIIGREFYRVVIKNRGYKDGIVGVIEGIYQPFSLFCVYVRLWELQQKPTIEEKYKNLEEKIDAI